MTYYGGKEMAASFRTVRDNTLKIAEEIPEDKYGFKPADDCRTIGQTLTHIALGPGSSTTSRATRSPTSRPSIPPFSTKRRPSSANRVARGRSCLG